MSVISVRVGGVTALSAVVVTEVSSATQVFIHVSDAPDLSGATIYGPFAPSAQNIVKADITGLSPTVRYYYAVEHLGVIDTALSGQFVTIVEDGEPFSHTWGMAGDAGLDPTTPGIGAVLDATRLSNHAIFAQIRQRALNEGWVGFVHLGDRHYYDLGGGSGVGTSSVANFRRSHSDVMLQTNQHLLYRDVPTVDMWDDHDGAGGNDGSGSVDPTGYDNAAQVYRERVPHYPLALTSGGIHHSVTVGRVLYVFLDCRFYADLNTDPDTPGKTMLGIQQREWLESLLRTTPAKALILVMSRQWIREGEDTWLVFQDEQQEILTQIGNYGWNDRMAVVYADRHAFHLQSQPHPFGNMPVLTAAPLDADGGSPAGGYPDGIPDDPGPSHSQYGTVAVVDDGDTITITLSGWRDTDLLGTYSFTVDTPTPSVIASTDVIARTIAGSHQVAFEARVVTTYQDGDDPTGVDIPIIDGTVSLSASSDVSGNLDITTDGDGTWPMRPTELLAPFGNEIFVRRGLILDGGTLWTPLGYYRIQEPQQGLAPDGPIAIAGMDRMAGLIDARLLAPRQFTSDRTLHSVFDELVREIYPEATIIFDDATEFDAIGRDIIAEDSRYDVLKELTDSHGKVMFWDTSGILRIQSIPDPQVPKWHVTGGRIGSTLINSTRTVTRDGIYNAVVATGEGAATDEEVVRAVAYDDNENSPTYFFGRFGQVPRYYSSPMIQNETQAFNAAAGLLRKSLGFPYNVSFTSIVNPAMRPYDPVQLLLRDGHRELHVIDSLSIPLTADRSMSARTRQQVLVNVGAL